MYVFTAFSFRILSPVSSWESLLERDHSYVFIYICGMSGIRKLRLCLNTVLGKLSKEFLRTRRLPLRFIEFCFGSFHFFICFSHFFCETRVTDGLHIGIQRCCLHEKIARVTSGWSDMKPRDRQLN